MLPLSAWPAFNTAHPHPYFVSAAKLFNAARRMGYPIPAAIGMFVTQPDMEAAFKPRVVGDHGEAFNICQWHEPRISNILKGCNIDVTTETDLNRLAMAMDWELRNTHRRAREAILAAENAADAARAACTYYEGAGAADAAERRANEAERWSAFIGRNLAWVEAQG